jgi:hypothetical protein
MRIFRASLSFVIAGGLLLTIGILAGFLFVGLSAMGAGLGVKSENGSGDVYVPMAPILMTLLISCPILCIAGGFLLMVWNNLRLLMDSNGIRTIDIKGRSTQRASWNEIDSVEKLKGRFGLIYWKVWFGSKFFVINCCYWQFRDVVNEIYLHAPHLNQ